MTKEEVFEIMKKNPVFFLATAEEDQPHVRGMLLFKADENGIIFHTAVCKDLHKQIERNPKVELCFAYNGTQIRVIGKLERVYDKNLESEIVSHPTRKFMRPWYEHGLMKDGLAVYRLSHGVAIKWTMEENFNEKTPINLW